MNKLFHIRTFGCQMNEHDSQKMASLLTTMGYQPIVNQDGADLILFNTCTVRQKAHDKAFSEIGRAISSCVVRRASCVNSTRNTQYARPIIAVCGCVAQEEGAKLLSRFPEVDMVFGPDQIYQLPTLLKIIEETGKPVVATELINHSEDYHFLDAMDATRLHGPKAFVTIMKGCNSHCSYCIVPKVRGTEVYRKAGAIIREVESLVEKGCKEVTLLGQNVNSYKDGTSFAGLIRLVSENTGVERIRFTSPHPKDVKDDLIEEYAANPKLCPHIHLPLQSGSDTVLKRMRRAYNTRTYFSKVKRLREARLDIAVTTDMIVGFPGETESEFQQTLEFVQKAAFDGMFAFKYSPRRGTEAHTLPDDVPQAVKEERLSTLLSLQNEISKQINEGHLGSSQEVLVEGGDKKERGQWMGRASNNKIVNFTGKHCPIGAIVKVEITKANSNSLEGVLR